MQWLVQWPLSICPACGNTPDCPTWLGATALVGYPVRSCEPYPCRCAPKWGNCRYKRCDCWGREPADGLPRICCAFAPDNPSLVPVGTAPQTLRGSGGYVDSPEAVSVSPSASEIPGRDISGVGQPPDLPPDAWQRRWTPDELTCTCSTPWEGRPLGSGVHCTDCHHNFKSQLVYSMHKRDLQPCRDPRQICDVDTGLSLLVLSTAQVWTLSPLPTWRGPRAGDQPRHGD